MEKTDKSTKIKGNDKTIKSSQDQNISNQKKSSKAEQSNKISTWLCKPIKQEYPSKGLSGGNIKEVNKTESKNEQYGKGNSKRKENTLKTKNEQSGIKRDNKEEPSSSSTKKTKRKKKDVNVLPTRTLPRIKKSSSENALNITPIKGKHKDDTFLRRLDALKTCSAPVIKNIFSNCEGDKLDTPIGISGSTQECCNKDKIYKKKRRESKSREKGESHTKRQKLDSDNKKRTLRTENEEPSKKKYKKDDKQEVKRKEKTNEYKNSPSDMINKWLTKVVPKKVKDRNPSSSNNNDKRKPQERGELDTKQQKADSGRLKKSSQNNVESSRKNYTKNKVQNVKHNEKMKPLNVTIEDKKSITKKSRYKTNNENAHGFLSEQVNLDNFIQKSLKTKKTKFTRTESSESCDFPSFGNPIGKSKSKQSNELFKKYGVALPSIEEILKEQKDLEQYKNQIEAFQEIEHRSFDLPFSVKDLNRAEVNCVPILGCKHLTTDEITEAFKKNLLFISDIFYGRKYNERHDRFFNKENKSYSLTIKDLSYSTSMIVFSFEQKEHMIKLLKDEFDPDDKWTPYFFQVLLPELCLKIFMDVHEMSYEEAVKYLDVRPITND